KKDSSLVRAFEYTKNEEECIGMVSAGSTGAVLIGATLKIGRIKGINRPALAPMLPTILGGKVLLLDCGANVDCKSHMLYQFAIMGNAYMQSVCGIDKPKIGLLCNGTEDKKGNDLTKETFALLKADDNIDFVGNMEARDILTGNYDVVVADGFNGNIALKSAEGTATMMLKLLKREMMANLWTKIGAAILKKPFMRVKKIMDYNQSGGAPFVGVSKPIIKSHGASKAESICGSIMQVLEMHKSKLIEKIEGALNDRNPQ
ncbi:MAG: phosphate acyltransferase PlsX, partial [Clostridia bacterium]